MEITTQPSVKEFTVIAGFQNGFENNLETLIFQLDDKQVKLNKEQCDELRRVLNGKCHKFFAFRNKEEYQHHSAMYVSSHGQPCGESVSYTETSFAKL
jgi:hypothetical protein